MKIVFVIFSLGQGGAERVVVKLANYMADVLGLDVTIAIFSKNNQFYTPSKNVCLFDLGQNVPQNRFISRIIAFYKRIQSLKAFFKAEKFDTIFSFMEGSNIPVILTGYPVIVSTRCPLFLFNKTYRFLFRLYNRKNVNKVVVLTHKMQADFKALGISNTIIIQNPIDIIPITERTKCNPYFLAVGRYAHEKNFTLLIKAFSQTKCKSEYELLIAGEGPKRQQLEFKIKNLGLEKKVRLLGLQNDNELHTLYTNARATILSSNFEGFPNVLIESLTRGTPVISTDCPDGPSEIVQHEINGILVPVNDCKRLAQAIDKLAHDKTSYDKYVLNARDSVSHLSIDKVASDWLNLTFPLES